MTRRLWRRSFDISAPGTTRRSAFPRRAVHGLIPTNLGGCGPDARLRKRPDRLRGALWQGPTAGALPGGGLSAPGSGLSRLPGCAISTRTARQSRHRPPTRPCGGRTPPENRQNSPVDALRQGWQNRAMNESEKQFFFTRATLSTGGRAKSKFLSYRFDQTILAAVPAQDFDRGDVFRSLSSARVVSSFPLCS